MRVSLPKTAEIRTIPKSLPRSFQNNFKCLFFKRLYQIDEILKYNIMSLLGTLGMGGAYIVYRIGKEICAEIKKSKSNNK